MQGQEVVKKMKMKWQGVIPAWLSEIAKSLKESYLWGTSWDAKYFYLTDGYTLFFAPLNDEIDISDYGIIAQTTEWWQINGKNKKDDPHKAFWNELKNAYSVSITAEGTNEPRTDAVSVVIDTGKVQYTFKGRGQFNGVYKVIPDPSEMSSASIVLKYNPAKGTAGEIVIDEEHRFNAFETRTDYHTNTKKSNYYPNFLKILGILAKHGIVFGRTYAKDCYTPVVIELVDATTGKTIGWMLTMGVGD